MDTVPKGMFTIEKVADDNLFENVDNVVSNILTSNYISNYYFLSL